jgi:hypothetical protein
MDREIANFIDICMWVSLTIGSVGLMGAPAGHIVRKGAGAILFVSCVYFAFAMFTIGRW